MIFPYQNSPHYVALEGAIRRDHAYARISRVSVHNHCDICAAFHVGLLLLSAHRTSLVERPVITDELLGRYQKLIGNKAYYRRVKSEEDHLYKTVSNKGCWCCKRIVWNLNEARERICTNCGTYVYFG